MESDLSPSPSKGYFSYGLLSDQHWPTFEEGSFGGSGVQPSIPRAANAENPIAEDISHWNSSAVYQSEYGASPTAPDSTQGLGVPLITSAGLPSPFWSGTALWNQPIDGSGCSGAKRLLGNTDLAGVLFDLFDPDHIRDGVSDLAGTPSEAIDSVPLGVDADTLSEHFPRNFHNYALG